MEKILIDAAGTDLRYLKRKTSRPDPNAIEMVIVGEDLQIQTRIGLGNPLATFNILEYKDTIERGTIEIVNVKVHDENVQLEIGYPGSPEILLEDKRGNIEGVYDCPVKKELVSSYLEHCGLLEMLKQHLQRHMREVLLKCSSHLRVPSVGRSAPNLERPPSDMFSGGDGIYIEESRQLQIGGTAIARASRSRSLGQTSHSTSPVGAIRKCPTIPTHPKTPSPVGSMSRSSPFAASLPVHTNLSAKSNRSSNSSSPSSRGSDEGVFSFEASPGASRPNSVEEQLVAEMQQALTESKMSSVTQLLPRVQIPVRNIGTVENGHQPCCHAAQINTACISRTNNDSDLTNSFKEPSTLRKKHPYEHAPKAPATLPPSAPPPFSRKIVAQEWYHPEMTKEISKQALSGKETGKFIIRSSAQMPGNYAIDIQFYGKVSSFHIQVDSNGHFQLASKAAIPLIFPSLEALVDHYRNNPISFDENNQMHLVRLLV